MKSELPFNLPSTLRAEPCSNDAFLLFGSAAEDFQLCEWDAISLPGLTRYMALSLHCHFVTSPTFGTQISNVPARCQFLLWEETDGRFGVILPLLHEDFRSEMRGIEGGLSFKSSCAEAGRARNDVALGMVCLRDDPYTAIRDASGQAVEWMGRGRLRTEKRVPNWLDLLGWCTWDAFYCEVDEKKLLEGLEHFREAGIVPGFLIVDEGWQDYDAKNFLLSYGAKKDAFTGDRLETLVRRAKEEYGVRMVGCWRTLFGELRGVDVQSAGLEPLKRHAVLEPDTNGDIFGVVRIPDVPRFHEEYASVLAAQGIDFVKVDFQSALHLMTYSEIGRSEAARIWQHAVQDSVEKHFHGEMLNCMAMGSDEVYHTRTSNVCRSSDDFFPSKDESHPTHIRQNLFNSLWLSQMEWPDWDMFQSGHPWARYHAMARAVSGGPVYVSDKPGTSDAGLLKSLVAADGKTLRCPQPALPCRENLLSDPLREHRLMKAFNTCGKIGLLGLFHPNPDLESGAIEEQVSSAHIEGLEGESFAVYSIQLGFLGLISPAEKQAIRIDPRGSDILFFSPVEHGFAPIGLVEKMNPAAAVLEFNATADQCSVTMRCGGVMAFYSERPVRSVTVDGREHPFEADGKFLRVAPCDGPLARLEIHT